MPEARPTTGEQQRAIYLDASAISALLKDVNSVKTKEEAWYREMHEAARVGLQPHVRKAIDEGAPWAMSRLGWLRALKANVKLQGDFLRVSGCLNPRFSGGGVS